MKRVLGIPAFRRLVATAILSEIGLSSAVVALTLLVYRQTGSAVGTAVFFLCAEFGPAFVSPLFIARFDQRAVRGVLSIMYTSEACIFLVLGLLVDDFSLVPVLVLTLVNGSIAVAAGVLGRAAATSVTSAAGLLREGNAVANTSISICYMLGPALGGAVVATGGARAALSVSVGIFLVSAVVIGTSRALPTGASQRQPLRGRIRAAVRYARGHQLIRKLIPLEAVAMLFFSISIPVEVVFVQHTLGAGPGSYGVLLSAWGVGAIGGSAIYARWRRTTTRFLITMGTFLLGSGFLVMAVAPNIDVAVLGSTIGGLGNGIQIVALRTALQEATPPEWMALILGLNESMFQAVPGAGFLLGGAIAELAGPRVALAVGAGGSICVAAAMWIALREAQTATESGGPIGTHERVSDPDPSVASRARS